MEKPKMINRVCPWCDEDFSAQPSERFIRTAGGNDCRIHEACWTLWGQAGKPPEAPKFGGFDRVMEPAGEPAGERARPAPPPKRP